MTVSLSFLHVLSSHVSGHFRGNPSIFFLDPRQIHSGMTLFVFLNAIDNRS